MVTITLYTRQQKRHRCIEQSFGLCGRRRGWDNLREYETCVFTKKQNCIKFYCCWGFPGDSDGKESDSNARDPGSIPGLGRCPGEGNGNLLRYSCL